MIFFQFFFPFVFRHSKISFLAFLWTLETLWAPFLNPSMGIWVCPQRLRWVEKFRGAWQVIVYRVSKTWTQLKWLSSRGGIFPLSQTVGVWGLTCESFQIYSWHSLGEPPLLCCRKLTWNVLNSSWGLNSHTKCTELTSWGAWKRPPHPPPQPAVSHSQAS